MRNLLRNIGHFWISRFGSPIRDEETGELLGRALVVVWRGKIHLIGFSGSMVLKPVFCVQDRVRYWRQTIGFTRPQEPDFPSKYPE
ncbi:hypothetical protein [Luteolibacter sp. LG18]|uniref:hypothetical protein n=1 Tax=Luteolibacter sp. LG18 TaxID=2819286 RepID=UPI002B2E3D0E|nr:hypothetical protein llg_16440 [Luteolibacter sp. LG18]